MSNVKEHLVELSPRGSSTELKIDGVVVAISPSEKDAMVWATLIACFDWDEEELLDAIIEYGIERVVRQNLQSEHQR